MAEDLYGELGVSRNATQEDIKKAYRKLAAELHPDRNQEDAKTEARFKRVNAAFHALSDPNKRKLYDRFGEAGLREGFNPNAAGGFGGGFGRGGRVNLEDIFGGGGGAGSGIGDMFGDLFGGGRGKRSHKPRDMQSEIAIEFNSAVRGAELELAVTGGRTVKVRIPKGADNGDKLRVKGGGAPGPGGAVGDLLLSLKVRPHPHFQRDGLDLTLEVPISVSEAHFGSKLDIPTIDGSVQLKVPAGSQSGQMMRLRGKGVTRGKATGDLYVRFLIRLPQVQNEAVDEAARVLGDATSLDLRETLKF